MTKMRVRPGYATSTRAHSALRGSIYGTAPRRPLLTGDYYVQRSFPSSYDTRSEEYSIGDSVLRATVHSDAVLDDTYDTSAKSRSRDRRLLSDVTNAIVSSESHSSPGSAVASRRAKSHPLTAPRPVVVSKSRLVDSKVAAISPPAFKLDHLTYWPYDNKRFIVVSKALTSNVPLRVIYTGADKWDSDVYLPTYLGWPTRSAYPYYYTTSTVPRRFRAVSTVNPSWASYTIARSRYLARSPLKTVRHPFIYRKIRKRAKAALVASRVEVEPPRRRRKPHSQYAANKLRETRRPGDQESYIPVSVNTAVLHASRPPFPLPSDRKAIRDVDGFTKPRNILSWQYRLESRVNPTEVMYKPGVYSRMREQVRDAHDKLDRHRQLLDRYMSETGDVNLNRHLKAVDSDDRIGGSRGRSSSAPPAPTQPAMSDLRRRLRKTICKSKRDPNYYRE